MTMGQFASTFSHACSAPDWLDDDELDDDVLRAELDERGYRAAHEPADRLYG